MNVNQKGTYERTKRVKKSTKYVKSTFYMYYTKELFFVPSMLRH